MPVFKRKLHCLEDFAEKLKTDPIAVHDHSEKVQRVLNRLDEKIGEILENKRKVCGNCGDDEKFKEKEEQLNKQVNNLKLLDLKLLNATKQNTDLDVKIKAIQQSNEEITEEILKLENALSSLEDKAALVEKEKMLQREKIQSQFKLFLTIYNIYKKYTACKLRFEGDDMVVFEFSPDVFVKLFSEDMKTNWLIIDIKPDLSNKNDLEKKLIETDDVQGLIACLHEALVPYF